MTTTSRLLLLAAAAAAALSLWAPGASAAPPSYLVGAAHVDTTPPARSSGADGKDFALCAPGMTGERKFAFEEPYVDTDGSKHFNYGEPYCDANHNGRYDGIYLSGGVDKLADKVHDPIDARAVALSRAGRTVVVASVVQQGLFQNVIERMRARARQLRPGISDLVVSANHNESSPDTVGIYGAPDLGGFGANSGIDDYFVSYLVERVARAAAAAYDARRPAQLYARQFPLPRNLRVQLSHNFPTTDDQRRPAAINPKIGLLQARDVHGRPIFTLMSLAAHNQEIGHSGALSREVSSDWPGYFQRKLDRSDAGVGMFLVGDNGSEEDPETVPAVSPKAHPECSDGCYAQARATGESFAAAVLHRRPVARLRGGGVGARRKLFFVPLENNLFKAAAAGGLFGDRPTYVNGVPAGRNGNELRTEVGVVDVGPDLQLLLNPGESFPALTVGSPWGIEDASCPERPNPPVPTWHATARYRLQVGLADDLIGYLIPAWGFSSERGTYATTCANDDNNRDQRGHQHKLEDESVGYTAGNLVAGHLTSLLSSRRDPTARIVRGRFVKRDGSVSHSPKAAAGVFIPGAHGGTLISTARVAAFGSRRTRVGRFIDFDGAVQSAPDITTRGIALVDGRGRVRTRYYLDVYPALNGLPKLGTARAARLSLSVRPRVVRAGRRVRLVFGVTVRGEAMRGARVHLAGQRSLRTDGRGRAAGVYRFTRTGARRLRAAARGLRPGRTSVAVRR